MCFKPFQTLFIKETMRFLKVAHQTITAPVITAFLYLLVFGNTLTQHVQVYPAVSYLAFLIPGLVMMSMLQNAFMNPASSLIISKMTGNLVLILLTPLSHLEFFAAYVLAAVFRAVLVGLGVLVIVCWFEPVPFVAPLWILVFALMGSALLASIGMIAGIHGENYDHVAGVQNFVIVPLTFLSGVFYSIKTLPPVWQQISYFNPFFYMIDGFRYGFIGHSDVSPYISLAVVSSFLLIFMGLTLTLIRRGYKLRH